MKVRTSIANIGTTAPGTAEAAATAGADTSLEREIERLKLENVQMRESIKILRRETEERFQRIEALLLGDKTAQQLQQPHQ